MILEGDYIFWIAHAEALSDGQLAVTFRIISGNRDALGRSLVRRFPSCGELVYTLREMLEACGKEVPRKKVRLNLDKMIGLECAGTVIDGGHGTLVISAFFSVADLQVKRNRVLVEMQMLETTVETRYVM
jgi:hypothetical protein